MLFLMILIREMLFPKVFISDLRQFNTEKMFEVFLYFLLLFLGLKKVTDDMKTHKNPDLRGNAPIPAKKEKSSSPPKYGASTATQKPPKFQLEGKKWIVEFQRNNSGLVIEDTEVNQSVYVYKCDGSTIQVKGKVNNVILDSCKKTAVVFKSVVSSCEFINCQSVQMQVRISS